MNDFEVALRNTLLGTEPSASELELGTTPHTGHLPGNYEAYRNSYGPIQITDGQVHLGDVHNHQCYRIEKLCLCGATPAEHVEGLSSVTSGSRTWLLHAVFAKEILRKVAENVLQKACYRPWAVATFRRLAFDHLLSGAINQWLASTTSKLLYVEYHSVNDNDGVDIAVATQTAAVIESANYPALLHIQAFEDIEGDHRSLNSWQSVKYMMLNISAKILSLLPEKFELTTETWDMLVRQANGNGLTFEQSYEIFAATLALAPARLHMVIAGRPAFFEEEDGTSSGHFGKFISTLRQTVENESRGIRAIIVSQHKIPALINCLHETEMKTIISSARTKAPQVSILMGREMTAE